MPCSRGARDQLAEVVDRAELRRGSPCARLRTRRSPTGCRRRLARRRACCSCPCGASGRSGGSAAGTARRSPAARHTAAALRHRRRCRGAARRAMPSAGTARTRSKSGRVRDRPTAPARARRSSRGSGPGSSPPARRAAGRVRAASTLRRRRRRSLPRAVMAPGVEVLASHRRPRVAPLRRSTPRPQRAATRRSSASTRRSKSWCHDKKASTQAHTV